MSPFPCRDEPFSLPPHPTRPRGRLESGRGPPSRWAGVPVSGGQGGLHQISEGGKFQPKAMVCFPIGLDGIGLGDRQHTSSNEGDHYRRRVFSLQCLVDRRELLQGPVIVDSDRVASGESRGDSTPLTVSDVDALKICVGLKFGQCDTFRVDVTDKEPRIEGRFEPGELLAVAVCYFLLPASHNR